MANACSIASDRHDWSDDAVTQEGGRAANGPDRLIRGVQNRLDLVAQQTDEALELQNQNQQAYRDKRGGEGEDDYRDIADRGCY